MLATSARVQKARWLARTGRTGEIQWRVYEKTKKITDKVIAANQENAGAATGPKTDRGKRASRGNAGKHYLTGKVVVPDADPENPDYQQALERWWNDFQPQNIWEEELVRDIVRQGIQISRVDKLLDREMANFLAEVEGTSIGSIDGIFSNKLTLPVEALDLPIQRGFNCERLTVRASSTQDNLQVGANRGPMLDQSGQPKPGYQMRGGKNDGDGTRLEIQAELGSTLDKLRRYRTALVRERYRAMEALRVAQEDRREREG